jgi:hypothetical protein
LRKELLDGLARSRATCDSATSWSDRSPQQIKAMIDIDEGLIWTRPAARANVTVEPMLDTGRNRQGHPRLSGDCAQTGVGILEPRKLAHEAGNNPASKRVQAAVPQIVQLMNSSSRFSSSKQKGPFCQAIH